LVAVIVSTPDDLEGVRVGRVQVDGTDATRAIAALLTSADQWEGVRAVLLDGVAFGGFNVVDLDALARRLGRPVVALTRRPPDFPKIRAALDTYFPKDARIRWARLRAHRLFEVPTAGAPILAACAGCTRADATALIHRATRRGYWPEPLRLARLVGRAVGRPIGPARRRRRAAIP
jgi:endonuclease V-like protein UPF0215 family